MPYPLVGDLAQWAAVLVIGGGFIWTWRRNGKDKAFDAGQLAEKITNLEKFAEEAKTESKVESERQHAKMDKILAGQNEMKTHCANVSGDLAGEIKALQKG